MLIKQNQFSSGIKTQIKQIIKSKLPHMPIAKLKAQEQKIRTTTRPSYVDKNKNIQTQIKENLQMIISKSAYLALRKQLKTVVLKYKAKQDEKKFKKAKQTLHSVVGRQPMEGYSLRVMGSLADENNLCQLWAILPDKLYSGAVYILHVQSNLALKLQEERIVLAPRQKTKQFQFYIQIRSGVQSLYQHSVFIRPSLTTKFLTLHGVLCLKQLNYQDECQQFYIKKVGLYQPRKLQSTVILLNPQDTTKRTHSLGVDPQTQQINYKKMNYSLQQRWLFSPAIVMHDRNIMVMGRGKQIDRINQGDIRLQQKDKGPQYVKQKSKLEELNDASINLISQVAKNLISQYDNDCCEIINLGISKSLTLKQQKGQYKLVFVPNNQKREWRIQCDGFSMKIKHQKRGQYLAVYNQQIILSKSPQYWQVFESHHNKQMKGSMKNQKHPQKHQNQKNPK